MKIYDTIIIGGGQAGLSVAYYFRRKDIDYILLDDQEKAGGAWLETWDSLKLFSPRKYSSLPGWQMPPGTSEYPTKNEFLEYLQAYEKRYDFPIQRKTKVQKVFKENNLFKVVTNKGDIFSKTLVSATGTAKNPFIPVYPKIDEFEGLQFHSKDYKNPDNLHQKKVLVVGGGNSGAQILAEVSKVATTKWVTLDTPHFLPEHIDGRYLFNQANNQYFNKETEQQEKVSLSDIVQIATVKEAKARDVYKDVRPFKSFYKNGVVWENGEKEKFDVVIWCTGFKPNLAHLRPLDIIKDDRIETKGTAAKGIDGLWLVGYGNWTDFASATIYGVGKTAKETVKKIKTYLK